LSDITPTDVAAFVTAQQRAGYKGWTVKGHLAALSGVFKYAGRHLGFAGTNPVALLDRVERPKLDDERPKRVLGRDELDRLIAAVDEPYRLIFEMTAETGARLGEALGLVWENVDLEKQTIKFTHQLGRGGERVPLKTERSRRTIEVTPDLVAKLREAKIHASRSGDHDFVFVAPRSGRPHDHRNVAGRVLARAVKRGGLEAVERDGDEVEPAPTFHNLRHSHGSALIAAGWDIEEVSARLGHADVSITMRTYVHEYEAARRSDDRRNRLTALYSRAEQTETSGADVVPLRK
ncbi:MAG: tyrosine-type recombinase/integrase, partial [Solirubrobacteraceae bacterium]